jgi:hypothetical protein
MLQVHGATNGQHIENSPQGKLLDVVTRTAATNEDCVTLHIDLEKLNPAARAVPDVTGDGLLHSIHQYGEPFTTALVAQVGNTTLADPMCKQVPPTPGIWQMSADRSFTHGPPGPSLLLSGNVFHCGRMFCKYLAYQLKSAGQISIFDRRPRVLSPDKRI